MLDVRNLHFMKIIVEKDIHDSRLNQHKALSFVQVRELDENVEIKS